LTVFYGTVTEEAEEPFISLLNLSIGNIRLPLEGAWRFCISGQVCSPYVYQDVQGLFTSVPADGSYSITVHGPSSGYLPPGPDAAFQVSSDRWFFPVAYFILMTPSAPFVESCAPSGSDSHLESGVLVASAESRHSTPFEDTRGVEGTVGFPFSLKLEESHLDLSPVVDATADFEGTTGFTLSLPLDESVGLPFSPKLEESHLGDSAPLEVTSGFEGTESFTLSVTLHESVRLPFSLKLEESHLGDSPALEVTAGSSTSSSTANPRETPLGHSLAVEETADFIPSANDRPAPAEGAALSSGAVVGIVLAAVVVALVVGFLALRHFGSGVEAGDGEAPRGADEFAPDAGPNEDHEHSDESFDSIGAE
jgi:hypothetical protein